MNRSHVAILGLLISTLLFLYIIPVPQQDLSQTITTPSTHVLADGDEWLAGLRYRKAITIMADYQSSEYATFRVTVSRDYGKDRSDIIYTNGQCRSDFSDIRFTDSDGVSPLFYWMRPVDPGAISAVFYFKLAQTFLGNLTVYIYYGLIESPAVSSSPGEVFRFFDDFSSSEVDWSQWSSSDSSAYTISVLNALSCTKPSSPTGYIHSKGPIDTPCRIEFRVKATFSDDHDFSIYFTEDITTQFSGSYYTGFVSRGSLSGTHATIRYGGPGENQTVNWNPENWADVIMCVDQAAVNITIIQGPNRWTIGGQDASYSDDSRYLRIMNNSTAPVYIDDVVVFNYAADGPRIIQIGGAEETTVANIRPIVIASVSLGLVGIAMVGFFIIRRRRGVTDESQMTLRMPRERVTTPMTDEQMIASVAAAGTAPRMVAQPGAIPTTHAITIASGFDVAGENLKLGVKVKNNMEYIITNVRVILDVPDGFEFINNTSEIQDLGSIPGDGFQSAIFWLKPVRCVDGEYGGTVVFTDARGEQHVVPIPAKRIVNICPMLTATERADEVFKRLKSGALSRNCSSFEFKGSPRTVLKLAEARLTGLTAVDRTEDEYEDGVYLGYSCYVGQTKYGESQFAAEIQVSGAADGGVLTISVYSDDERILSGFFVDIMYDIREHIEILKEKMCPIAACPKCGGNIDLAKVDSSRIFKCEYCGTMGKLAPWMQ